MAIALTHLLISNWQGALMGYRYISFGYVMEILTTTQGHYLAMSKIFGLRFDRAIRRRRIPENGSPTTKYYEEVAQDLKIKISDYLFKVASVVVAIPNRHRHRQG